MPKGKGYGMGRKSKGNSVKAKMVEEVRRISPKGKILAEEMLGSAMQPSMRMMAMNKKSK